jgi:hypothetical protein
VVNAFNIDPTRTQVGIVTFSPVRLEFTLKKYKTKQSLLGAIGALSYHGGDTSTGPALDFVRANSFTPSEGGRADAPNILIVMTDGKSVDTAATKRAAQRIHGYSMKTVQEAHLG